MLVLSLVLLSPSTMRSISSRLTALVVGDGVLLILISLLFRGVHVQDAVGVDIKGRIDLRLAARDAVEVEFAEELAVAGHRALALTKQY